MNVLAIFGTRPEAIKMAPVVARLQQEPGVTTTVCVTGQHQQMLQQVLDLFRIVPRYNLGLMTPNQSLNGLTARMFAALDPVLEQLAPDCVLVHGDTTTAMVAALAAFHRRIAIGHVEAGLRTGDLDQPWPEEMNRRVVDAVGRWLFAPTETARAHLLREHLSGQIVVTGNTVIDALHSTVARLQANPDLCQAVDARLPVTPPQSRLLLVTGHRRENFGAGFAGICRALRQLAQRPDLQIVYPVHLNPNVRGPVLAELGQLPQVHLIEPQDYLAFVRLMQRATLILTDSGGVQEEAPSLGKPVLVMRDVTERPEAVAAGTVELVGTDPQRIVAAVERLLDDAALAASFAQRHNPYGDGRAAERIVGSLLGRSVDRFVAEAEGRACSG